MDTIAKPFIEQLKESPKELEHENQQTKTELQYPKYIQWTVL